MNADTFRCPMIARLDQWQRDRRYLARIARVLGDQYTVGDLLTVSTRRPLAPKSGDYW
jgi:hypothetical protein